MSFVCKCNYTTSKGSNMLNHFKKKNKCSELDELIKNDILHKCNYCSKRYRKSKEEHESKYKCSIKSIEDMKKNMENMEKKIEEMEKKIEKHNNISNNITNNNITNNNIIMLNSYMDYSTRHITTEGIIKFIEDKHISGFCPYIFDMIFYNQECPENHSIFYIEDKCIFVNQGSFNFKKLTLDEFNKFTDDKIYKTCIRMLNTVPKNKICDSDFESIKNYKNKIENKDSEILKQDKDDIKEIMIYGNNNIDLYSKLIENPDKYILPTKLTKYIKSVIIQNNDLEINNRLITNKLII